MTKWCQILETKVILKQLQQNITLTLMLMSLTVKKTKKQKNPHDGCEGYKWHHWWIHSGLLIHGRVGMMVLVHLLWHKSMIKVIELTGEGPSMDELGKVRIVFNVQYVLCTHNHPAPAVSEGSVYHWAAQINCCKAVSSDPAHIRDSANYPSASNPPQMRVVATLLYFNLLIF